ncbi:MAG: hypothetical protein ABIS27_00735 [Longimicrobiales bacterium]
MKRMFVLTIGLTLYAAAASAQDVTPFEVTMDRVKVASGGNFGKSNTYIVPTVNLYISMHGSVWARKGGASSHGVYSVEGLEKSHLQELSTKVQDDLVSKLRAAGYTVMTYADVKDHESVAGRGRLKADKDWGLPTRKGALRTVDFLHVSPSDEQAFDDPIQGPTWSFRGLAKGKDAVVIVPEIWYTVPQMFGETSASYSSNKAGVSLNPNMHLFLASITGINAKQGQALIQVQEHGARPAAENTGTITQDSKDRTTFNSAWKHSKGDYTMKLDVPVFDAGVLRVGYAINTMIVDEVKKAHK